MKVCFTSSSGGHFEQLMMMKSLFNNYNGFILTEKTKYNNDLGINNIYFMKQVNRKSILWLLPFLYNIFLSIYVLFKENPNVIVSTGALATVPICVVGKIIGKKIIYIESFAKVNSPTLTGKLLYKIADIFYVQWPEMLNIYPKAKYVGGIY